MPRPEYDIGKLTRLFGEFLETTSDLSEQAWCDFGKRTGAPASGTLVKHLGDSNYSTFIVDAARTHGVRGRVYAWPICPQGARHPRADYWTGTPEEYPLGHCLLCERSRERLAAWKERSPTIAAAYPELIPFLVREADSRIHGYVEFRCSSCGASPVQYSPKWFPSLPVCRRCRATGPATPGQAVERRGGGAKVKLEEEIAVALRGAGVNASADHGIVVPRGSYVADVVVPDVALLDVRVAVEVDYGRPRHNRHETREGAEDDRQRDALLTAVGWRTLRLRTPEMPTWDGGPWQITEKTRSPRKLADLIIAELRGAGIDAVRGPSDAHGEPDLEQLDEAESRR